MRANNGPLKYEQLSRQNRFFPTHQKAQKHICGTRTTDKADREANERETEPQHLSISLGDHRSPLLC